MKQLYQHLNAYDRCVISALKKEGLSNASIALRLGVHRSSIGREIARSTCDTYCHIQAECCGDNACAAASSAIACGVNAGIVNSYGA